MVTSKKRNAVGRENAMVDILIVGARVCDGTGHPWFPANVAIKGDRISAVGVSVRPPARRRINARGLILSPGFIDVHTHADGITEHPSAENLLQQGITTVVSGNSGSSALPVGRFLDKVEEACPAINYATLVGHGSIRRKAMGMAARRPDRKELLAMRNLAKRAMREGALGMSSGLFYLPGAWSARAEITDVAREIAAFGGVYATHKRSAGGKVFEAITEAAEIGRRAGIAVQISHLKVLHRRGRTRRDRMEKLIAHIRRYRDEGVDITWDIHPYLATSTGLSSVVIPEWVSEGGLLRERLKDRAVRRRIRREVAGKIAWIGGADKIRLLGGELSGKTLDQVARARKADPVTLAMDLVVEVGPQGIFHAMRQEDADMALTSELAMIASDGGVVPPRSGLVHPRNFGTFPRVLADYVRRRKLIGLEEAVRKMTFMPARKFGLTDRGLIVGGMKADLVLFDPEKIDSRAGFEHHDIAPEGISLTIVNGKKAWGPGHAARERHGEVLRGAAGRCFG